MPLHKVFEPQPGIKIGIWQLTESIDQLKEVVVVPLSFRSEKRLKEELGVYALLAAMTGNDQLIIQHEASGKPVLKGYHISISHTRGWVSIILSADYRVGIDIEYYSDRVSKVADRFIRDDEQRDSLGQQLINWSTKETVYKLFSEYNLDYFEMRLQALPPLQSSGGLLWRDDVPAKIQKGSVWVDVLKCKKEALVEYVLTSSYILTYSFVPFGSCLACTK